MKKSRGVPASLILVIASGIASTGCSSGSDMQCVDAMGRVIPDTYCNRSRGIGTYPAHWIRVDRGGFGSGGGGGGFFGS